MRARYVLVLPSSGTGALAQRGETSQAFPSYDDGSPCNHVADVERAP